MSDEEARRLAEEHWKFLEKWFHMIFVDGFVHGFGHGFEECEKKYKSNDGEGKNGK